MVKRRQREIPPLEWVAGILSLVIVVGTIGYLVFEIFQPRPDAPTLTVKVVQVRQSGGLFAVDVEVHNSSRGAAADVHVAGFARSGDGGEAHAEARVDHVPGFSKRSATLVFAHHPGDRPDVRVIGYTKP
jgi:uncharacterized protein (TIGR02588 family)